MCTTESTICLNGSETEPISVYCCPRDSALSQCRYGKTLTITTCAQEYRLDLVTLCSCFGLQHLPLLSLIPFSPLTLGLALMQVEVIL